MAEPPIIEEACDGCLLITLNRPTARNALDLSLTGALCRALESFDADRSLRVAVITGTSPGFCAGMDLKAFTDGEPIWDSGADGRGLKRLLAEPISSKPVIAAVEGFAVAGGLELALACDIVVAGHSAKFGIPEVQRSLVAIGGALRRLPGRIGPGAAKQLALTGQLVDACRAHQIGLVDELVDDGAATEAAHRLARSICTAGPLAIAATKRILDRQADLQDSDFWIFQEDLSGPVWASRDAKEGASAFAEKRPPRWTGS